MVRGSNTGQTLIELLIVTVAIAGFFLGAAALASSALRAQSQYRFQNYKFGVRR